MNLASLDLNLLVALDALLAEAHVGRAARRIGLSQPAMSHALRRLRDVAGDPLLIRVGARMELTPRAEAMRAPLEKALEEVRSLFHAESFDPATSGRRFVLMMPDLLLDLLIPPLVARVGERAPGIRIDIIPWQSPVLATAELTRAVDFIISCTPDAFSGFHRQRLYLDADVLAVRRSHPVGTRLEHLPDFLAARHVAVIGRGADEDMIDGWLRSEGLARTIALAVPSYLQALHVAARSDLVAFAPGRLVAALAETLALIPVKPPVDPGNDEQFLFHPSRAQSDPGSIWLRGLILEIARIEAPGAPVGRCSGSLQFAGIPTEL